MNYHEMTMNEPRDSPQRRRQFLVICTVMAATFLYATVQAGAFVPVAITRADDNNGSSSSATACTFPGGPFVYRYTQRDYAATSSLKESVGHDLDMKPKEIADKIYAVYLDDPSTGELSGRQTRFAAGFLVTDKKTQSRVASTLLKVNDSEQVQKKLTKEDIRDLPADQLWPRLPYQQTQFPRVSSWWS